jgi:ABC-type uncharacterized transport system substrate-binding protein
LELIRELLPNPKTIVLLANPTNPNFRTDAPEMRAAADAIGLHLDVLTASTDGDLEAALATMVNQKTGALMVMPDPFFIARREQLVALAAQHDLPAIYPLREYVEVGGLISYGVRAVELYHLLGIHTGKILAGAKPADLPVQQATKFELVINLKAAKALGLTVPQSLLARADEVIE